MAGINILNHSNASFHNWLIYKSGDKKLFNNSHKYTGVLYDLGCGDGMYKDFFLKYADEYIGVDWAASVHDIQADIVANLNKPLPIADGKADTIVSLSVLEHLCEPQAFLNEAYRILRNEGNLILQVPWQWQIHESPHDFYRYTSYGLKYMLEKAGFTHIKIEPQTGFFSMWFLKFNYFTKRFIRGPLAVKYLLLMLILPFWTLGQVLAPMLDKLDRNWSAETSGYFVTAKKH